MTPFRIGFGYDIHQLVKNRPLILGGVRINHRLGLFGHSDADCLSHAIADAMLGAAGLQDIGHYFPETDAASKGMDSQIILKKTLQVIDQQGFSLVNIDTTVIAQAPKLASYIARMKKSLSKSLSISISNIGLKATTNEGLDSLGNKKAIATHAVCLIVKN